MNSNFVPTRVEVVRLPIGDRERYATWTELTAAVLSETRWTPADVHSYAESLAACTLSRGLPDSCPETAWAGRLFDAHAEVRWVRDRNDGALAAWITRECDDTRGDAAHYPEPDVPYYLHGVWHDGVGFAESRSSAKPLDYGLTATPGRRACILVREYRPAAPVAWPDGPAAAEAQLNRPRLLAHRFLTVQMEPER